MPKNAKKIDKNLANSSQNIPTPLSQTFSHQPSTTTPSTTTPLVPPSMIDLIPNPDEFGCSRTNLAITFVMLCCAVVGTWFAWSYLLTFGQLLYDGVGQTLEYAGQKATNAADYVKRQASIDHLIPVALSQRVASAAETLQTKWNDTINSIGGIEINLDDVFGDLIKCKQDALKYQYRKFKDLYVDKKIREQTDIFNIEHNTNREFWVKEFDKKYGLSGSTTWHNQLKNGDRRDNGIFWETRGLGRPPYPTTTYMPSLKSRGKDPGIFNSKDEKDEERNKIAKDEERNKIAMDEIGKEDAKWDDLAVFHIDEQKSPQTGYHDRADHLFENFTRQGGWVLSRNGNIFTFAEETIGKIMSSWVEEKLLLFFNPAETLGNSVTSVYQGQLVFWALQTACIKYRVNAEAFQLSDSDFVVKVAEKTQKFDAQLTSMFTRFFALCTLKYYYSVLPMSWGTTGLVIGAGAQCFII